MSEARSDLPPDTVQRLVSGLPRPANDGMVIARPDFPSQYTGMPDAAVAKPDNPGQYQGMPLAALIQKVGPEPLVDRIIQREGHSPAGVVNNPGNIKFVGLPGQQDSGVRAADGGTYASYDSPDAGRNGIRDLIMKASSGRMGAYGSSPTVQSFMDVYGNTGAGSAANGAAALVKQGYYDAANTANRGAQQAVAELGSYSKDLEQSMVRRRRAQEKADEAEEAAMKALAKPPQQPELDGIKNFSGLATLVGIIGGAFTKRPLVASLNAAGAAMEAYNSRDLEKYKIARDQWKTNTEFMFKLADMGARRVREILDDEALGLDERKTMIDLHLRASGQELLADKLRTQGAEDTRDYLERVREHTDKMALAQKSYERQMEQLRLDDKRYEAQLAGRPAAFMLHNWEQDYVREHNGEQPTGAQKNAAFAEYLKQVGSGGTAEAAGWELYQGPDGKLYRANKRSGEGIEELPEGATKVGTSPQRATNQSDAEVEFWANVLRNGGSLPPGLSRNASGGRLVEKIMAKIPDLAGAGAGDFIANISTVKADAHSLNNMTKMADAATSFEVTASRNFDVALKLSKDAVPTDWGPWLNQFIENAETQAGNKDVPPYVTAMLTGANEYAKIMSGSTGAQGSTVDSRKEAAGLFSPYLSAGQIDRVVAIAKTDMDNRKASLYGQIDDIKSRLRAAGSAEPTATQGQSPSGVIRYDAQGNRIR